MIQAYKNFWLGYLSFKERTPRKDFWRAILFHAIILAVLFVLSKGLETFWHPVLPDIWSGLSKLLMVAYSTYLLVGFLPFVAMTVRRLRDANLPWGRIFLYFLPFIGELALLIMAVLPTSKAEVVQVIPVFKHENLPQPKINESGKISFFKALKHYFTGYLDFRGRTTRRSFWWTQLVFIGGGFLFLLVLALSSWTEQAIFGENFIGTFVMEMVLGFYLLGILIPELSITVRRFHDAGMSNGKIIALLSSTWLSLSAVVILRQISAESYGVHTYQLLEYLFFLIFLVLVLAIILVTIMPTEELCKETSEQVD